MTTKENIIEAFWKIYAHKPLEKITIQELMDKAGYHRSVFYVYFKDIYDLLEQEENDIIDKLNEILPYIFYSIKNNHILIFSTHIMELALDLCDEIVILNNGILEKIDKENLDNEEFKNKIIDALKGE